MIILQVSVEEVGGIRTSDSRPIIRTGKLGKIATRTDPSVYSGFNEKSGIAFFISY